MQSTSQNDKLIKKKYAWEIESHDLLVIPSLSFSPTELATIPGVKHYEERVLYVLLALQNDPSTRLTIVTSAPIPEWILRYFYSLLQGDNHTTVDDYSTQVEFLSLHDESKSRCLTEKILSRPDILRRLQSPVENRPRRTLMVYRGTRFEAQLSQILQLPYYAAKEEHYIYGTKHGSRSLFRDVGVPCADGTYDAAFSATDLSRGIWSVLERHNCATKGVVKLADGFSGMGNAIIDLTNIQEQLQYMRSNAICSDDDEEFCYEKIEQVTIQAL